MAFVSLQRASGLITVSGRLPPKHRSHAISVIIVIGRRRLFTEPSSEGDYTLSFASARRLLWARLLTATPTGHTHFLRSVLIINHPPDVARKSSGELHRAASHPWFDPAWYRRQNPAVDAAGIEPFAHYLSTGWKKNRHPHPGFDNTHYLARHPALMLGEVSPLEHWNTTPHASAIRPVRSNAFAAPCEFSRARPYRFAAPEQMRRQRDAYLRLRPPQNRIALYTCIVGGYDTLRLPEHLSPEIDYHVFTDQPLQGYGVFTVHQIERRYTDEPTRSARYLKLNAHASLTGYDIIVFIDANVLIRGDLAAIARAFAATGAPLGFLPHPARDCLYEEAVHCFASGKDRAEKMVPQLLAYQAEGYPLNHGLIEANIFAFRPGHAGVPEFFTAWWTELENGSRRDQLSANYVLWKHGLRHILLLGPGRNTRNHPAFALLPHGTHDAPAFAHLTG